MTAKVILNPYSKRWDALKRQPEAEAALQQAGLDYELVATEKPGHGVELAAEAVEQGYEPIIAAGGDSTINEVVNGLLKARGDQPLPNLGVLALGTANDFVDNLGLSRDLKVAAKSFIEGRTRLIDVCQVNDRFFVNNSAVGLEPYITTIQMEIHRVQGIVRYLLATLIGISHKPEWQMDITWDTGKYSGPVTLVSVGNSPRTGGLFYLTPHAVADDGMLTFLIGSAPTRRQLLNILPKAMRPGEGNVSTDPRVFEGHTTQLRIVSSTHTPMHTDGEVLTREALELNYRIFPARLPVIISQ
jgi:diacylglycerol kinase (ATP)